MSNVLSNVQQSIQILDDIQSAIASKGVPVSDNVPASQYSNRVREINAWKPHPDWWDIDKVWNDDKNQFSRKMLVLTDDTAPLTYNLNGTGIKGYCTSDNPEFIAVNTTSNFTITMTGLNDKLCFDGYKTRWVFLFYDDTFRDVAGIINSANLSIRYIIHNLDYLGRAGAMSLYSKVANLEFIKSYGNTDWNINAPSANNILISLQNKTLRLASESDILYESLLKEFPNTKKIIIVNDIVKCGSLNSAFIRCYNLKTIAGILDATNVTNAVNAFGFCSYLRDMKIYGLKCDLNLNTCYNLSHESLLYLLLNAQDVSADQQTLTLGATNLVKLSDDEKAIATAKGWILA